jgi:hypothetical protein
MVSAHARRADAEDAVVRAEVARTMSRQAAERLAARGLELELKRGHTSADAQRGLLGTGARRGG